MSYSVKVLSGESIFWETWGSDFDPETDLELVTREDLKILDASNGPMVGIVDIRSVALTVNDILFLANHGLPEELSSHPKLRRIILISTDEIVNVAAKGMDSEVFGFVKMDIMSSDDEALALARQYLK